MVEDSPEAIIADLAQWCDWRPYDAFGTVMLYCPLCETAFERGTAPEHDENCPISRARAIVARQASEAVRQ